MFKRYFGSTFRITDKAKRRPDLYSSKWIAMRKRVIQEDGTICSYCGSDCSSDPTVDHVIPICHGGEIVRENLVVACRHCNSKKGGREGWV